MAEQPIDLRSDTVTKPTARMRQAIASAEVGDDVYSEDPTVCRLQDQLAEMLGKEAALFMSSGTMTNQVGVRIHCKPGDEFICEAGCHIYNAEQGAFAQLSGVVPRILEGESGVLRLPRLVGLIRHENVHLVRTRLVCLENTHNASGGRVQPYDVIEEVCDWAHGNGLRVHLDGARLFNAVVASGISAADWSQHFDTVSVCFSKGLGAPVGSALAGSRDAIAEALRHRKLFGGGMRQAGVIAAGALFALENNVQRLADDHANAQILADSVGIAEGITLWPEQIETNLVFFEVDPEVCTAAGFVGALKRHGVLMLALGPTRVRAVLHLDVSEADIRRAAEIVPRVAEQIASGALQPIDDGPGY